MQRSAIARRWIGATLCVAPVVLAGASFAGGLSSERNPFDGFFLVACATLVGLVNQWTSFGRGLMHRARGGDPHTYRHVSGLPVVGTILTLAATSLFFGAEWTAAVGLFALAIDTGGSPWFLAAVWKDESFWS